MYKYLPLLLLLTSCAALERTIEITRPDGTVEDVRIGDVVADAVDGYSKPAASIISKVIPNPIAGAGIGAALLAAAGAASAGLRKKKQTPKA